MQFDISTLSQSSDTFPGTKYCSTFSDQRSNETGIEHFVYLTPTTNKQALLVELLKCEPESKAIVYVRTNFASDSLAEHLNRAGITTESIHENKSARTRIKSLANFRSNLTRILVVTESSASSLNIADVSLFVNYDLPLSADTFTQRVTLHPSTVKTLSLGDFSERGRVQNINRVLSNKMTQIEIPCAGR